MRGTRSLAAGGVVLALLAAEFPLAALAHQNVATGSGGGPIWLSAPFAVIGFVVALRKPGNRLGWILLGLGCFSALAQDASFYVVACYRLRHGGLPFGWVALLAQPTGSAWMPKGTSCCSTIPPARRPGGAPPRPRCF
jgi:hypothetical protein